MRRLHRFYLEYPTEHLVDAVRDALRFGLLDLARVERMTLRRIRGDASTRSFTLQDRLSTLNPILRG